VKLLMHAEAHCTAQHRISRWIDLPVEHIGTAPQVAARCFDLIRSRLRLQRKNSLFAARHLQRDRTLRIVDTLVKTQRKPNIVTAKDRPRLRIGGDQLDLCERRLRQQQGKQHQTLYRAQANSLYIPRRPGVRRRKHDRRAAELLSCVKLLHIASRDYRGRSERFAVLQQGHFIELRCEAILVHQVHKRIQ
jgi:hypothetical protein